MKVYTPFLKLKFLENFIIKCVKKLNKAALIFESGGDLKEISEIQVNSYKNLNLKNFCFGLFHLFIFSTYAVNANEVNCNFQENLAQKDLNLCALKEREFSSRKLALYLDDKLLRKWEIVAKEVCFESWKKYSKGSIFPLLIYNCQTRMNNYLLDSRIKGLKGK